MTLAAPATFRAKAAIFSRSSALFTGPRRVTFPFVVMIFTFLAVKESEPSPTTALRISCVIFRSDVLFPCRSASERGRPRPVGSPSCYPRRRVQRRPQAFSATRPWRRESYRTQTRRRPIGGRRRHDGRRGFVGSSVNRVGRNIGSNVGRSIGRGRDERFRIARRVVRAFRRLSVARTSRDERANQRTEIVLHLSSPELAARTERRGLFLGGG